MNEILQAIGVAIVLALAIVWIARRARRKNDGCDSACEGCELARNCTKREIKREISKK